MGLIYVITLIAILVIFMMIKKSDKELNSLAFLGLGIVLILCYNVFECYVLNFLRIKITLLNLSVANFVVIILGIVYLIRKKEIQRYYTRTEDTIFITSIAIVVIVIGYIQYGPNLNIKYEISDSITHYRAAQDFAHADTLLNLEPDELWGFKEWKLASYVNSGLIMKIFSNVMDDFYYYKIFILFGLFILFMTGYMMYIGLTRICKEKISLLAFVVSLLYILGYPLNSLLFGFEYMSMGILIITTLLYVVDIFNKKELKFKIILGILFLLNFQLFNAYYQYVPYVYSALFIYICFVNYKEDKKIFTKKNIVTLLVTLIIPFILGFLYYFAQGFYNLAFIFDTNEFNSIWDIFRKEAENSLKTQGVFLSAFDIKGYVYQNLYSNILLLLPLLIYVIVKDIKEKKTIEFSSLVTLFCIGYIVLLFIGNLMGKVSDYYVAKNYFSLWALLWYVNFKGLYYLYKNNKWLPCVLIVGYVIILIISYLSFNMRNIDNKLKNYNFRGFTEIYNVNEFLLNTSLSDYYDREIEIIKYAKENLDKEKTIEVLGAEYQIMWAYPLLDYVAYHEEMQKYDFQHKLMYKHMNNKVIDRADIVICFYRSPFYRAYDKSLLDGKEVIYENSFGKIVKMSKND